jgi:hypothetical protein
MGNTPMALHNVLITKGRYSGRRFLMEQKMKQWQVVQHIFEGQPKYTLSLVESDGVTLSFFLNISLEATDGKLMATKTDENDVEVYTEFPIEQLPDFLLQVSNQMGCLIGYGGKVEDIPND